MISLSDICFSYENTTILNHVNAEIETGTAVLLHGPNGAGKTTLLRLLNGLLFPSKGTYTFAGEEITAQKLEDRKFAKSFHQRLGYVWQNPDSQLFCATVEEELAFGPLQMGLPQGEIKKRVSDAMDLLSITHLARRAPYSLSGGEKKRTAIGAILTMNPKVWTFDEPESYLDEKGLSLLSEFLPALKKAGKTLIIATHHPEIMEGLFDQEIRLEKVVSG